jgi:hypothetical protein
MSTVSQSLLPVHAASAALQRLLMLHDSIQQGLTSVASTVVQLCVLL